MEQTKSIALSFIVFEIFDVEEYRYLENPG